MADPVSATVLTTAVSAGSSGLKVAGSLMGAQAEKQKYAQQALKMKEAAAWGRVKATETDTAFREELEQQMANLSGIRAAQNADLNSPTSIALAERAQDVGDKRRSNEVRNINRQVNQAEGDAAALRKAGSAALTAGWLKAAPDILGAAQSGVNFGQSLGKLGG